jgi:hypothetical protein
MGAVMPNAREPGRRLVRGRVDAYLQAELTATSPGSLSPPPSSPVRGCHDPSQRGEGRAEIVGIPRPRRVRRGVFVRGRATPRLPAIVPRRHRGRAGPLRPVAGRYRADPAHHPVPPDGRRRRSSRHHGCGLGSAGFSAGRALQLSHVPRALENVGRCRRPFVPAAGKRVGNVSGWASFWPPRSGLWTNVTFPWRAGWVASQQAHKHVGGSSWPPRRTSSSPTGTAW